MILVKKIESGVEGSSEAIDAYGYDNATAGRHAYKFYKSFTSTDPAYEPSNLY